MNNIPRTVSFSGALLERMKREGLSEQMQKSLREKAEAYLSSPLYAVTERMTRAVSGNVHDYCSIGTYWWPNPNTENGLPYIRRDGYASPAATDTITYDAMTQKAFTLALAAYYFDELKYAEAAEKALYDWHLNPETYMTPHAEYSQAIPGICSGRGIGIIDFSMRSYRVYDAISILKYLGKITEERVAEYGDWYNKFTDWMLTSENGLEEECEPNNHGTYFDVHLLATAIFTNRPALVKKVCTTAYERRIISQIEPDGSQPLELLRTKAMIYSLSNNWAHSLLANMAASQGYTKYWGENSKFGDNAIKKAIDFLYPYYEYPETFPYEEIKFGTVHLYMARMLSVLDAHFPNEDYGARAKAIIEAYADKTSLPEWLYYPLK